MDKKITKEIADQVLNQAVLDELDKRNVERKAREVELIPELVCDVRKEPLKKEDIEDVYAEQANAKAEAVETLLNTYKGKDVGDRTINDYVHMASRLVSDAGLITKCVEDEKIVEKIDDVDKAKEVVDEIHDYIKEEGDIHIPKAETELQDLQVELENKENELQALSESGQSESEEYSNLKDEYYAIDKRIKDIVHNLEKASALSDKADEKKK